MNDRELLELAAKAIGWDLVWNGIGGDLPNPIFFDEEGITTGETWNPLTDDGDAFRLAVKLGMGILYETQEALGGRMIEVSYDINEDEGTCNVATELLGDDPCTASRRAIVRAAAAIGAAEGKA